MKRVPAAALLLALALVACGPELNPPEKAGRTVDPETRDRVKTTLFEQLVLKKAEVGARFPDALPEMQDGIARDEEFEDWEDYLLCLRATEPGADLALAQDITAWMAEILTGDGTPEEPR